MSWLKEGIEKLISLSAPSNVVVQDRDFITTNTKEVQPHEISPIAVHSLQAIVDYLNGCSDSGEKMLHVASHSTVHVLDIAACEIYRTRETYMVSTLVQDKFPFGQYLPQEDMIVALHTQFRQSENRDKIIRICSGLIVKGEVEITDDGLSQRVQAQTGITRVQSVDIENPVTLQPVRTFTEVEQPAAPYVVRIRGGEKAPPTVAIFEADGGQWKNVAIANIKRWLAERTEVKILG